MAQIQVIIKGKKAKGIYDPDTNKLIIQEGTEISKTESNTLGDSYKNKRKELISSGIVKNYIFSEDYECGSPSTASNIILGRQSNGKDEFTIAGTKTTINMYLSSLSDDEVKKFHEYYLKNKDLSAHVDVSKKLNSLREDFEKEYPLKRLMTLKLEEYAQGNQIDTALCSQLEHGKYTDFGPGLGGGSAYKFGIFKHLDKKRYVSQLYPDGIDDPESYWETLRQHIVSIITAVAVAKEPEDIFDEYKDFKGMSIVPLKIAYYYYPEKFISIGKKGTLIKILDAFHIDYDQNRSAIKLNFKLAQGIREINEDFKKADYNVLSRLLWMYFGQDTDKTQKTWLIAAGNKGNLRDRFKKDNVIAIDYPDLGDLRQYISKNQILQSLGGKEKSITALTNRNFLTGINVGDIVYAKQGIHDFLGKGTVTGEYYFDENSGLSLRKVEWEDTNKKTTPKNFTMAQKTLTDITGDKGYEKVISELYGSGGSGIPPSLYNKQKFLDEVFMTEDMYVTIVDTLDRKKNIILTGVPGVGKTFSAKKLIHSILGTVNNDNIVTVQFHQSYSYEDFVQGYRPNDDGTFYLKNGIFYELVKKARDNYKTALMNGEEPKKFFMIIDEINRGNLSKVFGELMMLIEADKRNPNWSVKLTYSDEDFYIPSNLYIIGTMNTADRSLTMVDYALRRRFSFINLSPVFSDPILCDKFKYYLSSEIPVENIDIIINKFKSLNTFISKELGEDFQIGHSYFINQNGLDDDFEHIYNDIINYEIKPLLEEYFFDDKNKVSEALDIIKL